MCMRSRSDRKAALGVPLRSAGAQWTRAQRRRRRQRQGVWTNAEGGVRAERCDGAPGRSDAHLLQPGQGTFGVQPAVANGRVYLGSQYGSGPGGGVLIALNAATGAKLWTFDTVTGPEPGVKALGLGAGGVWETPLVSSDGSVTFGIGNPYQTPAQAIAHPARILYTDSDVNLDAATGKLRWYYQGVPDDFKDYDMQTSPVATRVGHTPVVIGSGKMGIVYEMNAKTGTAAMEDTGRRAQRPRQRWSACPRSPAEDHRSVHHRSRLLRRSADEPRVCRQHGVRGDDGPAAQLPEPEAAERDQARRTGERRDPGAQPQPARWSGTPSCRRCRSAPRPSQTTLCSQRSTTVCSSPSTERPGRSSTARCFLRRPTRRSRSRAPP